MKLFIQPVILREIGHIRIAKFLEPFREELGVAGIALPPMPDTTYNTLPEPEASRYFEAITTVFGTTERLPGRLRKAVAILEAAASDAERLDAAVQRRMPCVAVNRDCALDRALELWFAAPDELEPFAAKNEESSGAAVANGNSTGSFPLTPALSLSERESRLANGGTEGP